MNINRIGRRARPRGFTLIEMMITIAIIGIVASFAIPSYRQYVQRTQRGTAQAVLSETAQYMERVFTTSGSYATGTVVSAVSPKGSSSTKVRYNISFVAAPTATAYTVQAVPVNGQTGDSCGTLTLTQSGAQTPAGCW